MKGQFFPYYDTESRKKFPYVTVSLIAVNVIIFLISLLDFENIIMNFGFIPIHFSVITIFTSMFLHGGFDHIFGNMWYLWIFGDNVEEFFGKVKYTIIYFLSGLSATFFHWLSGPLSAVPSIGASGAISGILGSYIVLYPKAGVVTGGGHLPAYFVIGFWFVLQLIFGAVSLVGETGSGIAFWAHVGGFVFGAIFTWIYKKFKDK
jgi:membrane associated rhomboid family serine protease